MSSFDDVRFKLLKIQSLVNVGKGVADKSYMGKVMQMLQDPQIQSVKLIDVIQNRSKSRTSNEEQIQLTRPKQKRSKSAYKLESSQQLSQRSFDIESNIQRRCNSRLDHFMTQLLKSEDKNQLFRPRSTSPTKEWSHKRSSSKLEGDLRSSQQSSQIINGVQDPQAQKIYLMQGKQKKDIINKMLEIGGEPLVKFVDFLDIKYFEDLIEVKQKYKQEKQKLGLIIQIKPVNMLEDFTPSQNAVQSFLEGQKMLNTLIKSKKMIQQQKDIVLLRTVLVLLGQQANEDDSVLSYKAITILQQTKLTHPYLNDATICQLENKLFGKQRNIQSKSLVISHQNKPRLIKLMQQLYSEDKFTTSIQSISKMNVIVNEIAKHIGIGYLSKAKFLNA